MNRFHSQLSTDYDRKRIKKVILLLITILIGTFFRVHQLPQIPPGDGFDPAYYGLDALRILDGEFPIYFATNFGREPLFSYLVALIYAAVGPGTFGIHLTSAFVSILTIPALFLAADELFKREKQGYLANFGGLVAALILTLSFWHLIWSRYSVRAILIPLFISLLSFFLLRGWRTRRRRDFLLAGIVIGISFYTYQLAQLFPFLVFAGFIYQIIADRRTFRRRVGEMGLTFLPALLLVAPLLFFAWQNPGVFNQRVGDVFVLRDITDRQEQARLLLQNMQQVARMYTVAGDTDPLINIPGRPSLNPFLAVAFLGGLLIAFFRIRRPAYFYLLTWLALLSAPAFLATKAALSKRALGTLPAVILLITLSLLLALDWLRKKRFSARNWTTRLGLLIVIAGVIFTAGTSYRDLFQVWGRDPELYAHFNVGVAEIGEYIAALPQAETIYLSPTWIEHATLRLHAENRQGIRAYNGRHCFVYPKETSAQTTYLVVPRDESTTLPLLDIAFPQGDIVHEGFMENGEHYFTAYRIPAGITNQLEAQSPAFANWDDRLSLVGFDLSTEQFKAGDTITTNLYLAPLTDLEKNYTLFLQLLGPENPMTNNPVWGQVDREPCFRSYPTSFWRSGEVMRDTFSLPIAPDAPPGEYKLIAGFYHWPELNRLPIVEASDEGDSGTIILHTIEIAP
jgi:4-amino-4-deoxy-L-arabinose transferase-like glycosyltransferase